MNRICNRCHKLIPYNGKCSCRANVDRNRVSKEYKFYNTNQWTKLRNITMSRFMYIDWYAYYKYGEVVQATVVHHIEEIKDNWDRRLDIDNLIPLSSKSHKEIHELYKKDRQATQKKLFEIVEFIRNL